MPKLKHIIQAARLRTLPLSVSGIIVGSALSYKVGQFSWLIFSLAILTTLGLQILSNFANDYGDGIKGTDNDNRIGPKRTVQSGAISLKTMKNIIYITAITTFIIACNLIFIAFGKHNLKLIILFTLLGISSIGAAIKYTVGSNAYGYRGLGDLFVFLFFGLLSVLGTYTLYTKSINSLIFLPATTVGLLSVGVLHLNNMRDAQSDLQSRKITLAVKIGHQNSRLYYLSLILTSFLASFIYNILVFKSYWQFLFTLSYIPISLQLSRILKNNNPKKIDPELKILALSTFVYAILISISIVY